ncbi:T9SS type A sorting domain-containing protein [Flavobacterium luteum]|uniref:T9SS type A sorting domain-containing protein n=1 Tax=Flavobacterium luteum TaxID=2026654 RepID=A0A7J5ACN2_9FLAO|nr:T9SS type A sorting domain-containing protein [Flavobacterium luteum]KAB1154849.1 T9SS type A sorting domain-containing protein [Flavobacterium luteum]
MKKITILIALMITSLGFAQQVVIENFEDPTNYTLQGGFAGVTSSITPDPAAGGTYLNVLKLNVSGPGAGVEVYEGEVVNLLKSKIKLTTDKTVKVDVFSSVAFSLMCKVENGTGPNSGASQVYTTPNAWQTLTFTFTEGRDATGTADGEYPKFVFFPNWKDDNTGFKNPPVAFTLYLDNITAEKAVVVPVVDPVPTEAAPTPTLQNASGVASIFSNQYTNIAINEWPTSWSSGTATDVQIAGDDTKKLKLANFIGIDFQSSPINATSMDRLHIDFWVKEDNLDGKVFDVKLVDFAGTSGEVTPTYVYHYESAGTTPVIQSGKWVTIDVPLKDGFGKSDIKQAVIISNMKGPIYIDNFYLYNSKLGTKTFAALGVKMFPNPTSNKLTIEAKGIIENVSLYNVLGQQMLVKSPKLQTATLDISNLQSGVYVVKTTIDGKVASSRVVKK